MHIQVCNEHFGDAHLHTLRPVMHILVLHITHFRSYNAHFWVLLCTFWVSITKCNMCITGPKVCNRQHQNVFWVDIQFRN